MADLHDDEDIPLGNGGASARAEGEEEAEELRPGAPEPEERARALLTEHPVADGHSGLPWALSRLTWYDLELGDTALQTDLPRLREGAVGAMFWSLRLPQAYEGNRAVSATLALIDLAETVVRAHPEGLRLAHTASHTADARAHGRIACMLGPAAATAIDDCLGTLRALHKLGVRSLAMSGTRWVGEQGLSRFGEEVVREMNRLGVLADLSGSSAATVKHVLTVSKAPVIFSRSAAHALTPHPDNVPDELLAALRDNNGLCLVPCTAAQTGPALRDVADHLDHVRRVAGPECVGISGMYDTESALPDGLHDTSRYPQLIAELLDRGWSDADVSRLTWGNVQRVLRDADFAARAAQLRRLPSTATLERLDGVREVGLVG
ncbi:dipeptidase [Streptomyces cavernicola]|uniref:Dipeptidase n=1 Tax=Streptomyces cavernicola TaxID=3043613 RepID=A0ABT6SP00_9ACTN|nr:dipeptidase [Streptomyces sp. B-S-A6]MDI3409163.1 dipeptidase [Streptomyces sp. B-S-A6]